MSFLHHSHDAPNSIGRKMEKPLPSSCQAGERGAGPAWGPPAAGHTQWSWGPSCYLPPRMINQGCLLAGDGGNSGVYPLGPPTHQGVWGDRDAGETTHPLCAGRACLWVRSSTSYFRPSRVSAPPPSQPQLSRALFSSSRALAPTTTQASDLVRGVGCRICHLGPLERLWGLQAGGDAPGRGTRGAGPWTSVCSAHRGTQVSVLVTSAPGHTFPRHLAPPPLTQSPPNCQTPSSWSSVQGRQMVLKE